MTARYHQLHLFEPGPPYAYSSRAAQMVQDAWDSIEFRGMMSLLSPEARCKPADQWGHAYDLVITIRPPDATGVYRQPGPQVKIDFYFKFRADTVDTPEMAREVVQQALKECWLHELDEACAMKDGTWLFNDPDEGHTT